MTTTDKSTKFGTDWNTKIVTVDDVEIGTFEYRSVKCHVGNGAKVHAGRSLVVTVAVAFTQTDRYGSKKQVPVGAEIWMIPSVGCGTTAYHRSGGFSTFWANANSKLADDTEITCDKCAAKVAKAAELDALIAELDAAAEPTTPAPTATPKTPAAAITAALASHKGEALTTPQIAALVPEFRYGQVSNSLTGTLLRKGIVAQTAVRATFTIN